MERTEAGEVLRAGFLQGNVVPNDANDVRLLLQILGECACCGH